MASKEQTMVRCKFQLTEVRTFTHGTQEFTFKPNYDTSIPEDQRFAKASPSGEFNKWQTELGPGQSPATSTARRQPTGRSRNPAAAMSESLPLATGSIRPLPIVARRGRGAG